MKTTTAFFGGFTIGYGNLRVFPSDALRLLPVGPTSSLRDMRRSLMDGGEADAKGSVHQPCGGCDANKESGRIFFVVCLRAGHDS